MSLILGVNLSHDSSAALLTEDGSVIAAVAEERLSRRKHDTRFPREAIATVTALAGERPVSRVVIGSHSDFSQVDGQFLAWLFREQDWPGFDAKHGYAYPPGFSVPDEISGSGRSASVRREQWLRSRLATSLESLGIYAPISFVNHHDSHAGSAMGASGFGSGLAISLDGEGDGESGIVRSFSTDLGGKLSAVDHVRIPKLDSIGRLYSAVTHRYNFKHNSHEGKITGLAAFGEAGPALQLLLDEVVVEDGAIKLGLPSSRVSRGLHQLTRSALGLPGLYSSVQDLADAAASKALKYEDLAYAVQEVLEAVVTQMIQFHATQTNERKIALAGGVFANVKLNQRLAELPEVEEVFIFPDMGDGGIAVGGVWDWMLNQGLLRPQQPITDVYWGPEPLDGANANSSEDTALPKAVAFEVARLLRSGAVVGLVHGRMEFGPRALLHRSILADPRNASINATLNARLKRTEFMPFAPVCLEDRFSELFDVSTHGSLKPFEFMTMTCKVHEAWRSRIPAVVHVDGTARPQLLRRGHHPLAESILEAFDKETGVPALVNTSFNVHEEPILTSESQALATLKAGIVDALVLNSKLVLSSNRETGPRFA